MSLVNYIEGEPGCIGHLDIKMRVEILRASHGLLGEPNVEFEPAARRRAEKKLPLGSSTKTEGGADLRQPCVRAWAAY